jgi:hypothetical protein
MPRIFTLFFFLLWISIALNKAIALNDGRLGLGMGKVKFKASTSALQGQIQRFFKGGGGFYL